VERRFLRRQVQGHVAARFMNVIVWLGLSGIGLTRGSPCALKHSLFDNKESLGGPTSLPRKMETRQAQLEARACTLRQRCRLGQNRLTQMAALGDPFERTLVVAATYVRIRADTRALV